MHRCLFVNSCEIELFEFSPTEAMCGHRKKLVIMNLILTLIQYLNYKSVTVHNKCSPHPTANLSALCNSRAKITCCSSELIFTFLYVGSSTYNTSEQFLSRIDLPFVNFTIPPNKGLRNRMSNIIRRYTDRMKFDAYMAFHFITFFHVLLVHFFFIIYMIYVA